MKCKLCAALVEQQDFCYGCNAYICEHCNTYPDVPGGKHSAEDHKRLREALKIVNEIVNKK